MIQSALHGGPNLGYFLLDINSNKTLSWPPTAQPSESNKNIQSQAIKTASLDHITKPSVLSSSPPECLLCRYETSWNEEKETQWPVLWERKKKKSRGGGGPDENWQPTVSVSLRSAIGRARRPRTSAHFMQTFHSSPAAIATETKPPPTAVLLLGPGQGALGGGVEWARWVEWLMRAKLFPGTHIHCCTDKVVKEEAALCSFVTQLQNRIHLALAQSLFWSGFRHTSRRHFVNYGRPGSIVSEVGGLLAFY